jgi:hypothetical protein
LNDQTRDFCVERNAHGPSARWSFEWHLPAMLRHRTLRFVLLPLAFGGPIPSNAVHIH